MNLCAQATNCFDRTIFKKIRDKLQSSEVYFTIKKHKEISKKILFLIFTSIIRKIKRQSKETSIAFEKKFFKE